MQRGPRATAPHGHPAAVAVTRKPRRDPGGRPRTGRARRQRCGAANAIAVPARTAPPAISVTVASAPAAVTVAADPACANDGATLTRRCSLTRCVSLPAGRERFHSKGGVNVDSPPLRRQPWGLTSPPADCMAEGNNAGGWHDRSSGDRPPPYPCRPLPSPGEPPDGGRPDKRMGGWRGGSEEGQLDGWDSGAGRAAPAVPSTAGGATSGDMSGEARPRPRPRGNTDASLPTPPTPHPPQAAAPAPTVGTRRPPAATADEQAAAKRRRLTPPTVGGMAAAEAVAAALPPPPTPIRAVATRAADGVATSAPSTLRRPATGGMAAALALVATLPPPPARGRSGNDAAGGGTAAVGRPTDGGAAVGPCTPGGGRPPGTPPRVGGGRLGDPRPSLLWPPLLAAAGAPSASPVQTEAVGDPSVGEEAATAASPVGGWRGGRRGAARVGEGAPPHAPVGVGRGGGAGGGAR